jgi:precorrin-3B synthase
MLSPGARVIRPTADVPTYGGGKLSAPTASDTVNARSAAALTMAGVTRADRCPGVLRPHLAQDGAVVRVRIPGGQTTGTALGRLSRIAREFGSGDLQLTSRASLQLRGLPDPLPDGFIRAVREAGFLPSETHERIRNIIASPLTGISGGIADVRPMVATLDARLCASPRLASLPSRFLFAIDDGRGDLSRTPVDLGYRAVDHDRGWLLVGGSGWGVPVSARDAVEKLLDLAQGFLRVSHGSGGVWHVRDLSSWAGSIAGGRAITLPHAMAGTPLGAIAGAASVQVPLALLTPAQAETVEACAGEVVITPSRGLVLPGAACHLIELVAAGLVADPDSPWSALSACVGAPSCQKSLINTRGYATALAQSGAALHRTHISGCERRCGAPTEPHQDLIAPTAAELLAAAGPVP